MEENVITKNWYDKIYKPILIIPIIMLLFSLVYLYNFNAKNGDVIYKDVSITGGTTVTVFDKNVNIEDLALELVKKFPDIEVKKFSDLRTGGQKGFFAETKANVDEIKPALEQYLGYKLTQDNSSVEFSGSTLSQGFYQQLRLALIIAFVLMAIVVFLVFKTFVPSAAVILSAFADIIMTVVVIDLLGISVSIAGVIAFLMLIGYSVDTDILLTSRVLKRHEGKVNDRIWSAFKTGITMTLTSIVAVIISYYMTHSVSEVLGQIFFILSIGLFFDIFNTWVTNASILKWYEERRVAR